MLTVIIAKYNAMETTGQQEGKYLQIGTARIYYQVAGVPDGPILLMLHGGLGTMEDTAALHPYLYQHYKVIKVDSRGHGRSTLGSEKLTYERIQHDVEQILHHLNINTLSVLGFSDGGIVAYRLAAFTKLNIKKIITIGATWHYKNTETTRPIFEKLTAQSWTEKFPDTVKLYEQLNPQPDFGKLVEAAKVMWLDAGASGHPNEAVSEITMPLLIIRGDKDHLTRAEDVIELSHIVKDANVFIVPFAAHDAFNQQADVIGKFVVDFLGGAR